MTVRTRFAPSPTGFMHVGGVRTALFAWAYARNQKGTFILRIEDTDKKRETSGARQHIMESLRWLGLEWDEGPDKGDHGPYVQSERLDIYKRYATQLIDAGLAYADPYTPDEIEAFRQQAKQEKRPFLYRDHRPDDPPAWDGSQPLRFKIPVLKRYEWDDAVRGKLSAGEEALDDFIIIKADGFPTYNFAHVIDDHEMAITHVMRGEEFLASVPKFLALHDAFGWEYPVFATLPPVLNAQGGKKLSKREGAQDVLEYRDKGYLPEALVNFLASLGWNDGSEQDVFTPEEIVARFSLERIQKSGARFDEDKLNWLNWQHFKRLNGADKVLKAVQGSFIDAGVYDHLVKSNEMYLDRAAHLATLKAANIADFARQFTIFVEKPDSDIDDEFLSSIDQQLTKALAAQYIDSYIEVLSNVDFSAGSLEDALRSRMERLEAKPRAYLNLLRWLISGQKISPGLFEMLELLGKEETLARLEAAKSQITT